MDRLALKTSIVQHMDAHGFLNVSKNTQEQIFKDVLPYPIQNLVKELVEAETYKVFYFQIDGTIYKFLFPWGTAYGDAYQTVKENFQKNKISAS